MYKTLLAALLLWTPLQAAAGEPNHFDIDPAQCLYTADVEQELADATGRLTWMGFLTNTDISIEVWVSQDDGSWVMFWKHPTDPVSCLLAYGPAQILIDQSEDG